MQTKSLLYGLIGFFLGGLLVSVAATTFEKPKSDTGTMAEMTASLVDKHGDAYDEEFINQMIAHHQGALDMAELSESRAKHEEIKQLSRDIAAAQQKEISLMKQWQVAWGYDASDTPAHNAH